LACESLDLEAMLVDGASRRRTIGPLMNIGQDGLLTAWLAAFGRAIAEVGAIIIVGGKHLWLHAHHDNCNRS
jgi:ABC-type tungstate transport system substrate-binding protein